MSARRQRFCVQTPQNPNSEQPTRLVASGPGSCWSIHAFSTASAFLGSGEYLVFNGDLLGFSRFLSPSPAGGGWASAASPGGFLSPRTRSLRREPHPAVPAGRRPSPCRGG